jgi:predicted nucleotide-binding protein
VRNISEVLRSGNQIRLLPSNHEKYLRHAKWKSVAQQALDGMPCFNKMGFNIKSLDADINILHEYIEKTKRSKRKQKRNAFVFVVIGRDEKLQSAFFEFLRAVGLRPIEWSQAVSLTKCPTPFIGDILERVFNKCQAVLVVFSGEDEARLKRDFLHSGDASFERKLTGQPRPNVIFEAGMAFGCNPNRTIVVEVGRIRPISDWAGRHFLRMDGSARSRKDLVERLKKANCLLGLSGSEWLTAGDFKPTRH